MDEKKAQAIEIIKNEISKISPTQKSQMSPSITEREVAASVMAGQFVRMAYKMTKSDTPLSLMPEGEAKEREAARLALVNEIAAAALEAAK